VDLIIVAATNHDMLLPATACLVQGALGARRAAAFDVRIACAGAVYALVTGAKFIADGSYETVLVVGAEVHSKMIDYTDRTTAVFFSDGAGAAVLRPTSAGRGLIAWDLGADGANGDAITVPAGGSRLPASHETVEKRLHYVKMEGRRVYDFAVRIFPYTVRRTLARAGLTTSDIDLLIAHQANINIIREGMAALKLSLNRTFNTLEKYGNASAASLFLTMAKAEEAGKLRPGDLLMLVAFGAGLAWGSAALRW
jgi:3-oxoacyl-[acyl-carrier-protein] synthase-3